MKKYNIKYYMLSGFILVALFFAFPHVLSKLNAEIEERSLSPIQGCYHVELKKKSKVIFGFESDSLEDVKKIEIKSEVLNEAFLLEDLMKSNWSKTSDGNVYLINLSKPITVDKNSMCVFEISGLPPQAHANIKIFTIRR